MKRTILVLIMVLVAGFAVVSNGSYACEHDEKGMMMKGMMGTSLVATSDGGVVVLKGDTLTKYDRNLNVVKTANISDGMMAGKGKKGKGCCMMGMDKKKADSAEDVTAPAAEDEHAGHHPENK